MKKEDQTTETDEETPSKSACGDATCSAADLRDEFERGIKAGAEFAAKENPEIAANILERFGLYPVHSQTVQGTVERDNDLEGFTESISELSKITRNL